MNPGYIAGFVCLYSRPELMWRYLLALLIIAAISYGFYYFTIKRLGSGVARTILTVVLAIFAIVGWHILYLIYIGGDILGCSFSPLLPS
ncbi:MAG TPA: hypothetical protein VF733_04405 [Candidatus Saccharimonadales bacterium]